MESTMPAEVEVNPPATISPDNYPEENALTPFEGDFMDITIQVAKNIEEYEKALNMIMNFIIKRTYSGDWVSHDKSNTPIEDRTANPSGAAMERVARDLGIQETKRTTPIKLFHGDKHPGHYYYQCEGDFEFRGRKIHAIGMASTLNPFYYKSQGSEKAPADIREEYIIRDCLRDCTKQGVKGMFGLRKIPIMKLKELGYDIAKIKYVNYQQGEKSASAKNPEATAAPAGAEEPLSDDVQHVLNIENMEAKLSKKGKAFFKVVDAEGPSYTAWGNATSGLIVTLTTAMKNKCPIRVMVKEGQYPTIVSVVS